jgi:hypothetical protein
MQHDFDNTFDALLHRAAARGASDVLPERADHLDAESVSAFVENVLPDTTRIRFAAHLADCSDCRQILVNFASIQEVEEIEIVEAVSAMPSNRRGWFADWFALPNLAYAAAALTVLFIGVFGFIAFQSRQETVAPTVALVETETEEKLEEKRRSARAQAPQPEPTPEPTPEIQTDASTNPAADNANLAENLNQNVSEQSPNRGLPPSMLATRGQNNTTEQPRRGTETAPRETPRPAAAEQQSQTLAGANNPATGNAVGSATPTPMRSTIPSAGAAAVLTTPNSANSNKAGDAELNLPETPAINSRAATGRAATKPNSLAVKTVGGKTFQKLGNVWRDPAYTGQTTVDIARGTDEFKKLAGGLRSIANGFAGETVIVVWQGKAYRIR